MNNFLKALKAETDYVYTENGALSHSTTLNGVLDLFAFGGAYRNRKDEECVELFLKAWNEDPELAMKCLFMIRDCRGGYGERRFFRVVMHELAKDISVTCYQDAVRKNLQYIPEMGRWDDLLYITFETSLWSDAMRIIQKQLYDDIVSIRTDSKEGVSLLGKWLPSENSSSKETKKLGNAVRESLHIDHKSYRQMLSRLRERIRVLERLMSQQRWDEIHFDTIPSKAGLKYKNAFAHNEFLAARYKEFMESKETKVNAGVLNPVDIAHQIFNAPYDTRNDSTTRNTWQKYWDNLPNYYNGREESGICVVDVSSSMSGQPMEAAVSLGAYIAERGNGPFKNHFITFSDHPSLVEFTGRDIYEKFIRARNADWGGSTNIEATMDLILQTAIKAGCGVPERLYVLTDMEFNFAVAGGSNEYKRKTLFERIESKFTAAGYKMPNVVFWNLDARHNLIPIIGDRYSYVSGFSPSMLDIILGGKTGWELCLEKLFSDRYQLIHA